jgi:DNA-binding CsgD family transcriptional regulator
MSPNTNAPRRGADMSPKEQETLTLLARSYNAAEIADLLDVSANYIYSLIRLLKARFGASTIAGIVSAAILEGIIAPDGTFLGGNGTPR